MEKLDEILKVCVAFGGATASYFYGGWSALLGVLLAFVVIDYITGVIASSIENKLKSSVGLIGIARKVYIFVLVAIAHLVDQTLGDAHFFRDATIFFYLANELLSIIENVGRTGLPLPDVLKNAVDVLKSKGDSKNE